MNSRIDIDSVKNMYNDMKEIWPHDDKWYQYTYSQISKFLHSIALKHNFNNQTEILNAGSGGNTYNIPGIHYHIDIADQKLKNIPNAYIGNIENMPFADNKFDVCICVGSVLNYCDALIAISELVRVLKQYGLLILDYDQSRSLEFIGTKHFNKTADIIETFNSGYTDKIWVYSQKYISSILRNFHVNVLDMHKYHILTPLIYRMTCDENKAAAFVKFDKVISHIPFLREFSCNVILCSQKI